MSTKSNPGSDEAIAQGCTCSVLDNGRGRGAWGGIKTNGELVFWITEGCPVHMPGWRSKNAEVEAKEGDRK